MTHYIFYNEALCETSCRGSFSCQTESSFLSQKWVGEARKYYL